jgi:nicotinamidase-related amidase
MSKALLVIDVQNEYFAGQHLIHNHETSFKNILKAIDHANEHGLKVIYVQHVVLVPNATAFARDSFGAEIRPELLVKKHDLIIEKHLPGSFTGTPLEEWLRVNEIDTITICGYMTHMCCDTTSRQAVHLGFKVEFLSDATGTLDLHNKAGSIDAESLHNAILVIQAARFANVMTTAEWISIKPV